MSDNQSSTMDFVRELRLRQWARQHFVPADARRSTWHPVVLDEMHRRDQELSDSARRTELTTPPSEPVPESSLQEHDDRPQLGSDVDMMPANDYRTGSGAAFVPLAPSGPWRFDAATAEVPKPHLRMNSTQLPHSSYASPSFGFY